MPYLTPEELPEDGDCRPLFIPASSEWLAIVSGALTELLKPYNWEKFGALTVEECVAASQLIIDNYYNDPCGGCETPDGTPILTVQADGKVKELKDGEWQDPSGDYALPPLEPIDAPTAGERRCLAAKNLANVLEQVYEDMTDNYNLDADPYVAFLSSVGKYSTVVLVALGFVSLGLGTILFGTWTLMYQALEFLTEDVWNTEFTDKLVCVLLSVASDDDGIVTFDWRAFTNRLAYQIDLGDPSLGELRLYAQILYMIQFIGVDGMNTAATTTAITDSDCSECLFWARKEDFSVEQWDWEIAEASPWGTLAVYSPPFTERADVNGPGIGYGTFCIITKYINFGTEAWCRVEIDYNYTPGNYGGSPNTGINISHSGDNIYSSLLEGDQTAVIDLSGFTEAGQFRIDMLLGLTNGTPMPGGSGAVYEIRWYGQGEAPAIGVEIDPVPEYCD